MRKVVLTAFILFIFCLIPFATLQASDKNQALNNKPCPCALFNRDLCETTPQMQGEDVVELQYRLKQLGFYHGSWNGIYDKNTANAVRSFQKARKLPVTGIVDQRTWAVLGDGFERPANASPEKPKENVNILVDLERLTLTVREGERPFKEYPVAAGKPSTPSPIGEWKIIEKDYDWGGAFGARWMGLNVPWGNYGIHGTNRPWSIGSPVSAGCIRMFNEDVIEVFEWVNVGTRVKIQAPLTWLAGSCNRTLKKGLCGQDVVYVQLLLKEAGFNPYYCDGWYGSLTEFAVRSYQMHNGLPVTGQVDEKTRLHLEEQVGVFEQDN